MKFLIFLFSLMFMSGCSISVESLNDSEKTATIHAAGVATFAGGCFWCIEPSYQEIEGIDAVVGYAGGDEASATYLQVVGGNTLHREAVQVFFDPNKILYEDLVQIFFTQIDPTDANGQFADRGFQYTPAIYYHSENQKNIIESIITHLEESEKFSSPLSVKIEPFTTFFPAEEYHQNYYKKAQEHYNRYKKGSGRSDFIEDTWAHDAAIWEMESLNNAEYQITEEEKQKAQLDPLSYHVIFENGTEKPFDNEYWNNDMDGIYVDKVSGSALFSSTHKYDSGTGWPSFWKTINEDEISTQADTTHGINRTEIRSETGHVGHVFEDGPLDKGGKRFCTNSASLQFIPKEEMLAKGYEKYLYLFEVK